MPVELIIAEKPSVARDLARVLKANKREDGYYRGERVWVTWCIGHMAQLVAPEHYDSAWQKWQRELLPMIPDQFALEPVPTSKQQFYILKKLLKDREVKGVINACDAGREGELIFRYVYDLAGGDKPVRRAWLASMTDEAIKAAFRGLRPGQEFDALADAARCRSEADWLVGLNATRAMTLQARAAGAQGIKVMSVGRVQTPTLAMLVHREQEIEAFVPQDFWQVFATFDAGPQDEGISTTYEGLWTRGRQDRFDTPDEAEQIIARVRDKLGNVVKMEQKDLREKPPLLFDLTSLQRAANQRYGYPAQATLDAAQALYEKHKLLTYPRTDSNYLTTDMKDTLPGVIQAIGVGPYQGFSQQLMQRAIKPSKRIINDAEVADHHAIIPTDKQPDLGRLPERERRIYDLVARRFLAAFFPDAVFATTLIETEVGEDKFVTRGKIRKVAGWQEVEPPSARRPDTPSAAEQGSKAKGKGKDDADEAILPSVQVGQDTPVSDTRLHQGKTQPPRRYSESALLGAMERAGRELDDAAMRRAMKDSGLGTPATRASIIETLLRRDFITRDRKNLVPTETGRALIEAIPIDDLKRADLTGQWEAKLSSIAQGQLPRDTFMREVRDLTEQLTRALLDQPLSLPASMMSARDSSYSGKGAKGRSGGSVSSSESLGTCPLCQTPVTEAPTFYTCAKGRDCSFIIFKTVASRKISPTLVKQLLKGEVSKPLKGFKSKANKEFEAALRLDDNGKIAFVFDQAPARPSRAQADAPQEAANAQEDAPPAKKKRASRAKPAPQPIQEDPGLELRPEPSHDAQPERDPPHDPVGLACPACRRGRIIQGKRAWGCDRWRAGCAFTLTFEHFGQPLAPEQAARLIVQGRTEVLDDLQPPAPGAQRLRGRLLLQDRAPYEVVLEPAGRTSS